MNDPTELFSNMYPVKFLDFSKTVLFVSAKLASHFQKPKILSTLLFTPVIVL